MVVYQVPDADSYEIQYGKKFVIQLSSYLFRFT